jgi:hypothetical protein
MLELIRLASGCGGIAGEEMANVASQSQAPRGAARRNNGPTGPKQTAGETKVTTAGRASEEAPDESQIKESGAQPAPSYGSQTETPHQDLISRRAYERFQMRGGEHGRDQDDWFEAERELNKGVDE